MVALQKTTQPGRKGLHQTALLPLAVPPAFVAAAGTLLSQFISDTSREQQQDSFQAAQAATRTTAHLG